MPRYFFHVKRGQVTVLDHEGIELENSAQAKKRQHGARNSVRRTTFGTERLLAVG